MPHAATSVAPGTRLRPEENASAAMIYQHEARGADHAITSAIDSHVQAEQGGEEDDGQAGTLAPVG